MKTSKPLANVFEKMQANGDIYKGEYEGLLLR